MRRRTIGAKSDSLNDLANGNIVRCSNCGYRLRARSPTSGEIASCPLCGSSFAGAGLPSVGVEPLPPLRSAQARRWRSVALEVAVVLFVIGVLVALFVPRVQINGVPGGRAHCQRNLKELAMALHVYHDRYKALPAQSITDENGRPMHSWRVALLPFMEQTKLYEAYDFDQPWDSPHNSALCEVYMDLFRCPGVPETGDEDAALTNYFVVAGDETMFGPNRWTRFSDVTDGLANTILVVECNSPDFRVKWYEPRDIPFDEMEFKLNPPQGIGVSSPHIDGASVAMADGSVRFVGDGSIGEPTFRYLLIRNDGMPVQLP